MPTSDFYRVLLVSAFSLRLFAPPIMSLFLIPVFVLTLAASGPAKAQSCSVALLHHQNRIGSRAMGQAEALTNRYRRIGLNQIDLDGRLIMSRTSATRLELRAAQTVASVLPLGSHLALLTHIGQTNSLPYFDGVLYAGPIDTPLNDDIENMGSNVSIKSLQMELTLKGNEVNRMQNALASNMRSLRKELGLQDFLDPFAMTFSMIEAVKNGSVALPKWRRYSVIRKNSKAYLPNSSSGLKREEGLQLAAEFFRLSSHRVERGHTIIISATTENRYNPTELVGLNGEDGTFSIQLRQHLYSGQLITAHSNFNLTALRGIFTESSTLDGFIFASDLSVVWVRRKGDPLILPVPEDLIDVDDYSSAP